ncbi:HTH-type transcriptional regulator CynR [Sporomusa carbonis]|uniref:LysR family transcriptional regulator n=1 Tax=Sporomusa carbonis TaxID=3076075 RepID=UPI003A702539
MELHQLEYFLTVSKLGNFTRAAEELHVAQPSVTKAIHKLEEELGVQLFDRSQKKIALTPEGQAFYARINKILFDIRQAVDEMEDFKKLNRGTIKFAAPPMIGAYLFPNIFNLFKNSYPNLDLVVYEEGSLAAQSMIEKEELDLGMIILPESRTVLNTVPITREEIMLCLSPQHPLSAAKSVCFTQLRDEPFILLKEEFFHRRLVLNECSRHGFTPHVVFSSSQIETIKAMVSGNVGISFLMNMVVRNHPHLVSVPLAEPLAITIGLVWKKGKYLSKAAQAFIDFIAAYTKSPSFQGSGTDQGQIGI